MGARDQGPRRTTFHDRGGSSARSRPPSTRAPERARDNPVGLLSGVAGRQVVVAEHEVLGQLEPVESRRTASSASARGAR